jgi:hypothetical protein
MGRWYYKLIASWNYFARNLILYHTPAPLVISSAEKPLPFLSRCLLFKCKEDDVYLDVYFNEIKYPGLGSNKMQTESQDKRTKNVQ